MLNAIKNLFKKKTVDEWIDPLKLYGKRGFLEGAREQGKKAKKYANLNLAQLMYHPAVTDEDFETLDKFISQIELKSRNYIKGI